jgi:palmitoyltransferase ZDHHC9/14/18
MFTLFDVATTIPGYLDKTKNSMTEEEFKKGNHTYVLKEKIYFLKYCKTCKIVRDIRSFHCKLCGVCVERHDHHCVFVGNCIGKNNTNKFCLFLFSIIIHSSIIAIPTDIKVIKTWINGGIDFNTFLDNAWFFMAVYSSAFFVTMIIFISFHLYLASKNITTNEHLRNMYPTNSFDKGCRKNLEEVFCNNK